MNKAEKAEVAKALAIMFHCFPQSAIADVDLQMEAYVFAVDDFPADMVLQAIRKITQGEGDHEGRSFAPSTAELCKEVRKRIEMAAIMSKRPNLKVVSAE